MKKILAFLLSLTLVSTMFALPAFADTNPFSDDEVEINNSGDPGTYTPIDLADDFANMGDKANNDTDSNDKNFSDYLNPSNGGGNGNIETETLTPDNGGNTGTTAPKGKDTAQKILDKANDAQDFADKHSGSSDSKTVSGSPSDPFDDVVRDPLNNGSDNTNSGAAQNSAQESKPDDLKGPSQTFTGDDGKQTTVYESGTVLKHNDDGTKSGYDNNGRKVTVDENGNASTDYPDGTKVTVNDDGTKTVNYPDGGREEHNADGSYTYIDVTGYRYDCASDGTKNGSIYFENGESIQITDEKGNYVVGSFEITGPNGEKVTYNNTLDFNKPFYDENGNRVDFGGSMTITAEGNGKSKSYTSEFNDTEDGVTLSTDYKDSDGNSVTVNGSSGQDENGNDVSNFEIHTKGDDGSSSDITVNSKQDENGNYNFEMNVNATGADGSTVTATATATESEDGSMQMNYESKDSDGSNTSLNMNVDAQNGTAIADYNYTEADGSSGSFNFSSQTNEDGSTSMNMSMNSENKENGDKFNLSMNGTMDENGNFSNATVNMSTTENGKTTTAALTADENGGTATLKSSDGTNITWENKNGDISSFNITNSEGGTLTENEDGSKEFIDPKTGNTFKTDEDGNISSCSITTEDGSTYNYSDGTGVLVDKDGHKLMWTHDEDGNWVFVTPNEGKYEIDPDGNLYYNGKPVNFDGKQVNVDTGFNMEATTLAPGFMEQICGTYHLTGTCVSTVTNSDRVETENKEFTVVISDAGNNCINMKREGSTGSGRNMTIDPETGVAFVDLSNEDGNSTLQLTFTVSDDAVHLDYESVSSYTVGDYEYHDNGQDIEPWYCTDTTKLSGDKAD
jgi:hypothetical protein